MNIPYDTLRAIECEYCGRHDGTHDQECPLHKPDAAQAIAAAAAREIGAAYDGASAEASARALFATNESDFAQIYRVLEARNAALSASIDVDFPQDIDWTQPHRFVPEPVAEGEEPLDQCFGCSAREDARIHHVGGDDPVLAQAIRDTVDGREAIIDGTVPREPIVPRVTREEKIDALRRAFASYDTLKERHSDLTADLKDAKDKVDRAARAVAESPADDMQMILGETSA